MRVLLVSDLFLPSYGGVERHVYTLAKYLANIGVDVDLLTEIDPDVNDDVFYKEKFHVIRDLNMKKRKMSVEWIYTYLKNSKEVVNKINTYGEEYDVVHYHGTHMIYFDEIRIRNPFVATIHGIFPSCISHWGVDRWCGEKPSAFNCTMCTIKIRKHYAPLFFGMLLYNKYYYDRMKKSLSEIDRIVSVSRYVGDIVEKSLELNNVSTIYNFIDVEGDILSHLNNEGDNNEVNKYDKYLLFSGRLDPEKGIKVLLESFKRVSDVREDLRLLISGKGTLRSFIEKACKENEKMEYLGFLPRDVQLSYLSRSLALVAPSVYPDACPTSILEAMALGVPVVATTLGGIPELVIDGKTGRLVEPNDPDDLASKIIEVVNNGPLSYRDECVNQALKFDIQNVGNEIFELYKNLMSGNVS